MFRTITITLVAAATFALTACNPATALRDGAADALVQQTFEQMRTGDSRLAENLTPELAAQISPQTLAPIRAQMPAGAPRTRKVIATNILSNAEGSYLTAADEYAYGDRTLLVETQLARPSKEKPWRVNGFHVQAATAAELAANSFAASGKSAGQYLFLVLAVLSPLTMIAALVKVLRTKGLRRKWLWGILAFVGLCQFQMNWATGAMAVNYLSIQLIGFGVVKGLSSLAPWLVTFSPPLGAVLILTGLWANPKRAKTKGPKAEEAF